MTTQSSSPWKTLINEKLEKEMLHRTIPLTSYYFMRQHILPNVFGKSQKAIMYWSGKSIGNDLEVSTLSQAIDCFETLQLGTIIVKHESSKQIVLRLQHSPLLQFVSIKGAPPIDLSFESGFIAGMLEKVLGKPVSGHYEIIEGNTEWPKVDMTMAID